MAVLMRGSELRRAVKWALSGGGYAGGVVKYFGPAAQGRVALTFDDGPIPGLTEVVLSILRRRGHEATFFVLGKAVERAPHALRAILDGGCEIGNHSYDHASFKSLSADAVAEQILRTDEIVRKAAGVTPTYVRPPFGHLSVPALLELFVRGRLPVVLWSACPRNEDRSSPTDIVEHLRGLSIRAGDIVLLHDDSRATVEALPAILDLLEEHGLRGTTVGTLLRGGDEAGDGSRSGSGATAAGSAGPPRDPASA